jgi:hypothetical protein
MKNTAMDMQPQDFSAAMKKLAKIKMTSFVIGRWVLVEVDKPKTNFFNGAQLDFYSQN